MRKLCLHHLYFAYPVLLLVVLNVIIIVGKSLCKNWLINV